MTPEIEELIQKIGHMAIENASNRNGRLLLHVYAELGVFSADLFYVYNNKVIFKLVPASIYKIISMFWKLWKEYHHNQEWCVMNYILEMDNSIKLDLVYSDQITESDELDGINIRERYVNKYFPNMKIDDFDNN